VSVEPCKMDAIVAMPDPGMSGYALRANSTYPLFPALASITHARAETRGDSEKPLLNRRAAQQRAGKSGAAVWARV